METIGCFTKGEHHAMVAAEGVVTTELRQGDGSNKQTSREVFRDQDDNDYG